MKTRVSTTKLGSELFYFHQVRTLHDRFTKSTCFNKPGLLTTRVYPVFKLDTKCSFVRTSLFDHTIPIYYSLKK